MTKAMTTGRLELLVLAVLAGAAILAVAWPWAIEAAGAAPSPPVRLTLAEALDLAARQSPELVSSLQALELSRSRLRESSGSRQPKVILQGSYYGTSAGSPTGALTPGASPSVRVTASQTLPGVLPEPFGVGLSPAELAAIDLDGAELDLAKSKQNVMFNVISAYLNVLKAQQIKSLNDDALEGASSFLDEVRSKLNLGVATQLDLMKAQSQFDQARFNQLKAGDDLDAAMRSLALLLGLPAETKCELVNDFRVEQEGRNLEELVKLAIENRVEVKQASLSVLKARAALETAKRSLWPSVGLSATYSNQGDISVSTAASLGLTSGEASWKVTFENEPPEETRSTTGPAPKSTSTVGIEVSWPLWDGGVAREKLGQAETNLEIQESMLERQKQTVTEDVYAASVALKQALLRLELAEKAVGEAEEALRVTEARFEAGAGVVAEVIDAAHSLASAKAGAVEALFDCYLARARLGKAVGLLGSEGWGK
ncbi:MAG: TolC family protein [Bacillota bacterium]